MKMFKQKHNLLIKTIKSLLIGSNTLPPFLQMAAIIVSALSYVLIIDSPEILTQIFGEILNSPPAIFFILTAILILKLITHLSFLPFFYVIIFYRVSRQTPDIVTAIIAAMLLINIAIDLLSNICFSFTTTNIQSQKLNFNKVFRLIIVSFGVLVSSWWIQSVYAHISAILALGILYATTCQSQMKQIRFKQLLLRVYAWMLFEHTKVIIMMNYSLSQVSLLLHLYPFALSQLVFLIYKCFSRVNTLTHLYIKEQFLSFCFELCTYIDSDQYNNQVQQQLLHFIDKDVNQGNDQMRNVLFQKSIALLQNKKDFMSQLLVAQIYIASKGQLLKSRLIIQSLRRRTKFYQFINNVLIYRLEEQIAQKYKETYENVQFQSFQQFVKAQNFKRLTLTTSVRRVELSLYMHRPNIEIDVLRKKSKQLVELYQLVDEAYKCIKARCVSMTALFIIYQQDVIGDRVKASNMAQDMQMHGNEQALNLNQDQKIFIQLSLQGDEISISRIGHNVSLLLDYKRKELQGTNINMLVPSFYKKTHSIVISERLNNNLQNVYIYHKKTLIKDCNSRYHQCHITVKLDYDIGGEITLIGFIHMRKNQAYDWNFYLFISQSGEIVQFSDNLNLHRTQAIESFHKNQYFAENQSIQSPHYHRGRYEVIEYHPIVTFYLEKEKVYFFVRMNPQQIKKTDQKMYEVQDYMMEEDEIAVEIPYAGNTQGNDPINMEAIYFSVFSKEYILLLILNFMVVGAIFFSEYLCIKSVQIKAEHQKYVVNAYDQFFSYYNYTFRIGLQMAYLDLNAQYGYTNPNWKLNIINESLQLQSANQFLKIYNGPKYPLNSLVPNLTYKKSNYQLVQQLITNSYLTESFSSDTFIRNQSIVRARLNSLPLFVNSILDYRINFFLQIGAFSLEDIYYNKLSVILLLSLTILFYLIIFRLQMKLRSSEHDSLDFICRIRPTKSEVAKMKAFVFTMTGQKINYCKKNNVPSSINFDNVRVKEQTQRTVKSLKSSISVNEASGRNLMNSSSFSSGSDYFQETTLRQPTEQAMHQIAELIPRQRSKITLIFPLVVIAIIWILALVNVFVNSNIRDVDEVQSSTSIIALYRPSAFYTRAIINIVNLFGLRSANPNVDATLFDKCQTSYTKYLATFVMPVFKEATLQDFTSFQSSLIDMTYGFLCSYMDCDPTYRQQINLVYINTIQKFSGMIPPIASYLKNSSLSQQEIKGRVNGDLKQLLDIMFYTQQLLRKWVIDLCQKYSQCYSVFIMNLMESKYFYIGSIITLSVIGSIQLMLFTVYIYLHQQELWKICRMTRLARDFKLQNQRSK